MNALGSYQFFTYEIRDEEIELKCFRIRLVLANRASYQTDWPIILDKNKLLSNRVRLRCVGENGLSQVVATIEKSTNGFILLKP